MADETNTVTAKLFGERKWQVDSTGTLQGVTRRYIIVRDALPAGTAAEEIASCVGLPAIGSKHSEKFDRLIVSGYSFEEGEDAEKRVLYCDVTYSVDAVTETDAEDQTKTQAVVSWGWHSGSVSRDLVRNAKDGSLVVNSAGQPFDSVPQIDFPAPTLNKVIKTKTRQSGWMGMQGKINSGAITIGGISAAAHQVRCVQVDEERLFNDEGDFKYQYSCAFQVMSNKTSIKGGSATEIGWDIAVVDCGTMQLVNDKLVPIKSISQETGQEVFCSSPVLLDGSGKAVLTKDAKAYAFQIQAYEETTFPVLMYSEP